MSPAPAFPPFRMERYYAPREFTARYLLCASDCESLSIGELLHLAGEDLGSFGNLRLGYIDSTGTHSLRSAIAAQFEQIDSQHVLVHSGAQEAIFTTFTALLHPGDHVIVHHPSYQSLSEVPAFRGCEVTLWTAREDHNWALDLNVLEGAITPRTRLIAINSPHSPTGAQLSRGDLETIVSLARRQGIVVFSDEVYRGLEYHESERLPAICDIYERGISLGVMSKGYGLAGLRIGWVATQSEQVLIQIAGIKDYTTICSSAPSDYLACHALGVGDRLLAASRDRILHNLPLLRAALEKHPRLVMVPPRAGPVGLIRVLGRPDIDAFCDETLRDSGILLLPGTVFDLSSQAFRVGFGRADFPDVLGRFVDYLAARGM